jgi:hypothetical protein
MKGRGRYPVARSWRGRDRYPVGKDRYPVERSRYQVESGLQERNMLAMESGCCFLT